MVSVPLVGLVHHLGRSSNVDHEWLIRMASKAPSLSYLYTVWLILLVGGIATPLESLEVSCDDEIPNCMNCIL